MSSASDPSSPAGAPRRGRVLHVVGGLDAEYGGATTSAVEMCRCLAQNGWAVSVVFAHGDRESWRDAATGLAAVGIQVLAFSSRPAMAARWGFSLRAAAWLLRHGSRFDVIHVHGAWNLIAIAAASAGRLRSVPTLISPHECLTDFDLFDGPGNLTLIKRVLRKYYSAVVQGVIVSSELERRDSHLGAAHVVPHSVSPGAPRNDTSCRPGHASPCELGFLGRLDPKKRVELALEMLARLPDGYSLAIAGSGPAEYASKLEEVSTALGITDRVRWTGFVVDAAREEFFDRVGLLVMPSAYECFGMSAAEAIARGTPVIVSSRTGIAELVRTNGCGVVVEEDRPEAWAAAVRRCCDPETHRRLIARCDQASLVLTAEAHAADLDRIYRGYLRCQRADCRW